MNGELRELLSEDEYAEARASTLTAFYTPASVARAMHGALAAMGFGAARKGASKADRVLEPGCGTGNFMAVSDAMGLGFSYDGIEVDRISATIAGHLHPLDHVVNAGFEECYVSSDSYDAVVGNVPYSDAIVLPGIDGRGSAPIHDWFIQKSVDALRPGGVAILLTSRHTMDKAGEAARRWIAQRAELVGMARLPEETFARQAGTEAVSDVLVLRKRAETVPDPQDAWVRTAALHAPDGSAVPVNAWLLDHPECVIGDPTLELGRHGYSYSLRSGLDADRIGERLSEVLSAQVSGLARAHDELGRRAEEPVCAVLPKDGGNALEYMLDDSGQLWYGDGETVEAVALPPADAERLAAMVRLRDNLRGLLSFERECPDDALVGERIAELDARYDEFVGRFGRISDRKNRSLWGQRSDYSISLLRNTEVTDSLGRFVSKSDILSRRVQSPARALPERVDDVRDALSISLDQTGGVDMALIARLCGMAEADAAEALGDALVRDPDTRKHLLAEAYLSGDVLGKLDRVDALLDEAERGGLRARHAAWLEACGVGVVEEALCEEVADEGFKREMNKVGGAWNAFCDPLHAKVAVDTDAAEDAALSRFRRSSYGRGLPSTVMRLVGDLRPGCALLDGEGAPQGLWKRYCLAAQMSDYRSGVSTAAQVQLVRAAALAPRDAVSDEALAALIAGRALVGKRAVAEALSDMLPGIDVPDEQALLDLRGNAAERNALALPLARALREDPDVLDYLLLAAERHDRRVAEEAERRGGYGYGYRYGAGGDEGFLEADAAGLASFKSERDAFEQAHPVEIDRERVAELRSLRTRLRQAAPARLEPSEIGIGLGAPWVPPAIYFQFAAETFGFAAAASAGAASETSVSKWELSRSDGTGTWRFNRSGAPELMPDVLRAFGTAEMNPIALMESAMNGSVINITKPDPNPPADKPDARVKDPAATAAAYRAREVIDKAFKDWAFADPERARKLADLYNRRFNNLAPRRYDGGYLTLPGSNPEICLRPHQRDAVARILQSDEGTLVAHSVGAGKTFAGVAAVYEARRIGKASKPLVVVPNHLTEQWAGDFLRLYPGARVLYMTRSDMGSQDATRAFWGRAATGDWDAVIVGQSRFDMLGLSHERKEAALTRRIEEIETSIALSRGDGNDFSVKQLEQMRKRVERQLDKLRSGNRTAGVSFEEVGFDFLLVDEAHGYKNLAVVGRSVAGMSSTSSQKCENLIDICDWMREQGKGGNIVFATGTPVSNTMSELYNMERYLAPGLLTSQGVFYFSDWAQSFGETVQSVEVKPEGKGFQVKERFARFHNLPELMSSFHSFADIMTADDLDLDVPEVVSETVAIPCTDEQRHLVELLSARAEDIRRGGVDPAVDNLLKITSEGRALALSPRLMEGIGEDEASYGGEQGKLSACAENVLRVWEETAAERGAQLVFCDTSTPGRKAWNVYDEVKAQLVAMGVPEGQIAFVHDAGNDPKRRDELFERVNDGEVRVLFGSTQKLGTGTNVQRRLAAIHDLDCPWRPADLEQRLGRIQRQGNMFKEVRDFRYVTTGTFDSYLYQTVERKQRFISQVFTNKNPARSGDDLDETVLDYATIKAVASGDPAVRERLLKENRLSELELQRQGWARGVEAARADAACKYAPMVETLSARAREVAEDEQAFKAALSRIRRDNAAGSGTCDVEVGGRRFFEKAPAVRAILDARLRMRSEGTYELGTYYGLGLSLDIDRELTAHLAVSGAHRHLSGKVLSAQLTGSETCLRQAERVVEGVAEGLAKCEERLAGAQEKLAAAEKAACAAWEFKGEYDTLKSELAQAPGLEEDLGPQRQAPKEAPAASCADNRAAAERFLDETAPRTVTEAAAATARRSL